MRERVSLVKDKLGREFGLREVSKPLGLICESARGAYPHIRRRGHISKANLRKHARGLPLAVTLPNHQSLVGQLTNLAKLPNLIQRMWA